MNLIVRIALVLIVASVVALNVSQLAQADLRVLYAAPIAQGNGDCSDWGNACTLQIALSRAVPGDEIWVQQGIYYPGEGGARTATFALKSGVALYGGFAGTETDRNQRDWRINVTVLSGDIDRNDVTDPNGVVTATANIQGSNAYHVVTGSGVDNTAILDGFVITAGQANGSYPHNCGGGVYNYSGSPRLANVIFSGNSAGSGGGMCNYASGPELTNVVFSGNSAGSGGGMINYQSDPKLINVLFSGNSASSGDGSGGGMACHSSSNPSLLKVTFIGNSASLGGGLYNRSSSPRLTNVIFRNNSARYGGGMYNWNNSSKLVNVLFSGNSADVYGGGMYNRQSGLTLVNVTFSGNFVNSGSNSDSGGGMYNNGGNPVLVNVVMWGNSAPEIYNSSSVPVISYSDIRGCGGSGGRWNPACGTDEGGNIDANPRFVDAAAGNLRLQLTSPAIDAGNNAVILIPATDLDDNQRFVDVRSVPDTGNGKPPIVDMGAYETQYVDVTISKSVMPSIVVPGQAITFTLRLSNSDKSSISAAGVVVTDTLPAILTNLSFTSTLVVTDTGHVPPYVWMVQDLALGQSGVITISGVLPVPLAARTFTNTATIAAAGDWGNDNNRAVITFTVANVAPIFTSEPITIAIQDVRYLYYIDARDDNGGWLSVTAPILPAWLRLYRDDYPHGIALLAGTPTNADVGEHLVMLQVTDSGGLTDTQTFTITVVNVNDMPTFTSTPVLAATQDETYTYAVEATDPDLLYGDTLAITAPTVPSWLILTDNGNGTAILSGTPGNADVGDYPVVLQVADSEGLTATQAFTITVANINDVPAFTSAPEIAATQDAIYVYLITTTDPDLLYGDTLVVSAPVKPAWLALADYGDGTAILTGIPGNTDVGDHLVVLQVADSGGLVATQAFTITVANVNDAPVFISRPVSAATQDEAYTYAVVVTDPDLPYGDTLAIIAPTIPSWLTLTDHGGGTATLSGIPTNADVGRHSVVLQVTDGEGLTNTQAFNITVANVNDAPTFVSTPVLTAFQGMTYTYAITITDPDLPYGDRIVILTPSFPSWLTLINHGDGRAMLYGMPTNADIGNYPIVLHAIDHSGLTARQAFTITVFNVNDAPAFTSVPVLAATQDVAYTYTVVATDPDLRYGDTLAITALTIPSWLTLADHGNGTATLSGVPGNTDVGNHLVVLQVTDGDGVTDTQSFTVTVANVNDAPAFVSMPVLAVTHDMIYTYIIVADDPDLLYGDTLIITAPVLPSWLMLADQGDGTAILSGIPGNANVGDHPVMLQVADSGGLTDTETFTITVVNVNDAPVFTSVPVLTATQDVAYTYTVVATDLDLPYGDTLAITAPTIPSWLTLADHGDGTATLSGVPGNADVGDHLVVLQVADSGGMTTTQTFTITVVNVNDAPAFVNTLVFVAVQDVLYTYTAIATDPDLSYGDTLAITALVLPSWLTLTDQGDGTARLVGTPTNADVGSHPVVLQVTDSGGLTATRAFIITVFNVNDAPAFTSTPELFALQGVTYTYAITTTDPDLLHGDVLTITAPVKPVWLTLTDYGDGTAVLTGVPTIFDMGRYPVVLQVADSGGLTATQTFTITIMRNPVALTYRVFLPLVVRNTP